MLGLSPCEGVAFPLWTQWVLTPLFCLRGCVSGPQAQCQLSEFQTPWRRGPGPVTAARNKVGAVTSWALAAQQIGRSWWARGQCIARGWISCTLPPFLWVRKSYTAWECCTGCLFSVTLNHALVSSLDGTYLPLHLAAQWNKNLGWTVDLKKKNFAGV